MSGNFVWVAENLTPGGLFPMCRIDGVRYCSDGIARSAEITAITGRYVRRDVKLITVLQTALSWPEDVANAK